MLILIFYAAEIDGHSNYGVLDTRHFDALLELTGPTIYTFLLCARQRMKLILTTYAVLLNMMLAVAGVENFGSRKLLFLVIQVISRLFADSLNN